ncbi:uncharacterized protein LOC125234635 [Leguminivora glycinivorella]|uniref:uncharacterized protein LOC125234635 n=1 Tax=Leguminivora glycinivorella TaxID=1035111 RepID=UPI0020106E5D|nr:uncharacterized protein LOC125234635 [Leguminivora glycinivorella]
MQSLSRVITSEQCDPASNRRHLGSGPSDVKSVTEEEENPKSTKFKLTRKKNECIKIATWNVRSLKKEGKLENTIQEMTRMKLDILGLSEIKYPDNGFVSTDEATLYYSGNPASDKKHHHGVGILVKNELTKYITNFLPFSERCMLLQISGQPFNISLIQAYAPTADKNDETIEEFYRQLEEIIKSIKSQDLVIILGDFNAKVGKGTVGKVVGDFGLGNRNVRGDRLIQFCEEKEFIITNTWYQHPPRRLYTWISPKDNSEKIVRNQIDYILVPSRFRNSVINVKTYPGADVGSDHNPVVAKLKLKLKQVKKPAQNRVNFDLNKLKNEDTKNKTKGYLNNEIYKMVSTDSEFQQQEVESHWEKLKSIILNTAETQLGYSKKPKSNNEWITDDILNLMKERKEYKDTNKKKYKELDNIIRNKIRKERDSYLQNKCDEIEKLDAKHDSLNLHKKIKDFTKTNRKHIISKLYDDQHNLVIDKDEQGRTWEQYIEKLFYDNRSNVHRENTENVAEGPPIIKSEVLKAIKSLKDGKAVGPDGVFAELLKLLDDNNVMVMSYVTTEMQRAFSSSRHAFLSSATLMASL